MVRSEHMAQNLVGLELSSILSGGSSILDILVFVVHGFEFVADVVIFDDHWGLCGSLDTSGTWTAQTLDSDGLNKIFGARAIRRRGVNGAS